MKLRTAALGRQGPAAVIGQVKAGKATVYRRWAGKEDLAFAALEQLYGQEFLNKLLSGSLDKDRLSAGLTFRKGLEEYLSALASPEYCHYHIAGVKPDQTRELRKALQEQLDSPAAMTYPKAMDALRKVVGKSKHAFPKINATSIVMEFLCGACHAVDEYTFYLTPRQLRELSDALKGRYVGIGVRLKADDNKILVAEVLADSPATEATPALAKNDQIMSIDKKSTLEMPPELAMEMLEGEEGSLVELVVANPEHGLRIVVLRRRALVLPSVSHEEYWPMPAAKKSLPDPSPWSPTGSHVKETEVVDMSATRGCGAFGGREST